MALGRSVPDVQGKEALALAGRRPGWLRARRSRPEPAGQAGGLMEQVHQLSRSSIALQLQQPAFEVSLLGGGLRGAPQSRPSNDEGWLNAPLRQSDRDAPDFLHRLG